MNVFQFDPLTGAYTRSALGQQMNQRIDTSQASETEFSVVLIDLDYFKSINDAFGLQRGDQALVEVTARMRTCIRREDQLYRYGGDEFVILLPGSSKADAIRVVERIREVVTASPLEGTPPVSLSASYGLATFPEDGYTPEGLFAVIDRRLHQGKALGRGQLIADEVQVGSKMQLKPPERMVERDFQYQQAQRFLEQLPLGGAILQVSGRPGAGRTRFLVEVSRLARLHGYAVWSVKGSSALRRRRGGALAQLQHKARLHPVRLSAPGFLAEIKNWVADQGLAGLLLCVDGLDGVDSMSLEVISALLEMAMEPAFPIGLIASAGHFSGELPGFDLNPRRIEVELKPVSENGLRIWLRYTLNKEPPDAFLSWFYQQTGGLPVNIVAGLEWLLEQGILRPQDGSWLLGDLPSALGVQRISASLPKSNLPPISSDLFGREEELWQLKHLVETCQQVTICGPDGMGKSRLALQVAAEVREVFTGGVFWLSLNEQQTGLHEQQTWLHEQRTWLHERQTREDVLFLLARLLKGQVHSRETMEEEVFRLYQHQKILLVLDSLSPNSPAARLVERLTQFAPGVHLLATSVLPLNLPLEYTLALGGLPYPQAEPAEAIALWEYLQSFPAVQLFLAGARSSLAAFQPGPEDWAAIARICRRVEGMPLAIEMAAVWVSSFSCKEIAGRIEQNIPFLSPPLSGQAGTASSLASPDDITGVMDSFWRLFSRAEQNVLSALSVFQGGFTAQAAERVAGASPFFLDALIAKRYLHVVSSQRYEMHFLLASYAAAQSKTDPSFEAAFRQRYADEYLGILAERRSQAAGWQDQHEALFQDLDNFRMAWEYAVAQRDYEKLLPSLDGLFYLFFHMGHFLEGMRLLTIALESLPSGRLASLETRLRASLLARLGEFNFHIGRYEEGVPVLEEAVGLLENLDQPAQLAEVLRMFANLAGAMGKYDRAIHLLQEGLAMTSEASDPFLYFNLLNRAGVMAYFKKDYRQANDFITQALEVARRMEDPSKVAVSLNNLGNIALDTGDCFRARQLLEESVRLCRNLGQVTLLSSVLDTLAKTEVALDDISSACVHFMESLQLVREKDAVPLALEILLGIAEMWQVTGQPALAGELIQYILKYGSMPNDVLERAETLSARLEELFREKPVVLSRWLDRPLRWVMIDVEEILASHPQ